MSSSSKPQNICSSELEHKLLAYGSYSNDCGLYAANMYYNIGEVEGGSTPLERRGSLSSTKNSSSPSDSPLENSIDSLNITSTPSIPFPHPRRRSSYSSSLSSSSNNSKQRDEVELLPPKGSSGHDGYLTPITGSPGSRKKMINTESSLENNSVMSSSLTANDAFDPDSSSSKPIYPAQDSREFYWNYVYSAASTVDEHHGSNDSDSAATIRASSSCQGYPGLNHEEKITSPSILAAASDCEQFCSLCATTSVSPARSSSMDVAIISCQECFFSRVVGDKLTVFFERMVTPDNKRIDVSLRAYDLKDLDNNTVAAEVHRAKVQIVIISNHFLEGLRHQASSRKKLSPINRVLRSKQVVAVLTGTTASQVLEGHQAFLARFHEWFTLELRSASKIDADFCKKFAEQVLRIYNLELSNSSNFSLFPKKVTKEQPKVVITLKKPIQTNEVVRVECSRGRETVALNNIVPLNPYTVIIRLPESLCLDKTALFEITLYVGQQKFGTKFVKYESQAKQSEEDVIEKMTRTLPGFLKLLDERTSQMLSKNFREHTDWSLDPDLEIMNDVLVSKEDNYPTPMHFAAFYGLEQTVWTLLDEADGLEQCSKRNDDNETPLDIAKGNIGVIIRDYQEMTRSWRAFQYVKDIVDRNSDDVTKVLSDQREDAEQNTANNNLATITVSPPFQAEAKPEDCNNEEGEEIQDLARDLRTGSHFEVPSKAQPHGMRVVNYQNSIDEESSMESPYANIMSNGKPLGTPNALSGSVPPSVRQRKLGHKSSKRHSTSAYANLNLLKPKDSAPVYTEVSELPLAGRKASESSDDSNYCVPRLDTYKIPPAGLRPFVTPEKKGGQEILSTQPGVDTIPRDSAGYLHMEIPTTTSSGKTNKQSNELFSLKSVIDNILAGGDGGDMPNSAYAELKSIYQVSSLSALQAQVKLDPPDEDLFELMNDYKNNVYSMRQLELLFEHWKRRTDVKMSYQDRHLRLKKMREEYKRIQDEMKQNNRRPSVLNKVLHFFNGRKKTSLSPAPGTIPEHGSEHKGEPTPILNSSFHQSNRNLSVDRESVGSSIATNNSEGSSKSTEQVVSWDNPRARRNVGATYTYVEPTMPLLPSEDAQKQMYQPPQTLHGVSSDSSAFVSDVKPLTTTDASYYYKEPPPPRPFKNSLPLCKIYPREGSNEDSAPDSSVGGTRGAEGINQVFSPEDDETESPPRPPRRTFL